MIGLKKGIVELVFHREEWSQIAQETISELREILSDIAIDIQHIGSTAIKGIHAKPVIDITIGMNNLNDIMNPDILSRLEDFGYIYRPENDGNWRRYFRKGPDECRTHHIHAVIYMEKDWKDLILFRDFLSSNPEWAKKYDSLKLSLMKQFKYQRDEYTEGKAQLILEILSVAQNS